MVELGVRCLTLESTTFCEALKGHARQGLFPSLMTTNMSSSSPSLAHRPEGLPYAVSPVIGLRARTYD